MSEWLSFKVDKTSSDTSARAGVVTTPKGDIPTPVFMPVGTAGTVKGVDPDLLSELGAPICLGNTYHLMNRPGHEQIRDLGGLHKFMAWDGSILTDSGGFQVFSLATLRKVTDNGVRFRSHIDGALYDMTPESTVGVQQALGSDIMMPLDICPPHPCSDKELDEALRLTTAWAKRSLSARERGALFSIVQGGCDKARRTRHVEELGGLGVDGFSIGGLSVGEDIPLMYEITEHTAPQLPKDKPRYLMGVGTPEDLVTCVGLGVDMFDCVMPTRHGRNGMAFTWDGNIVVKHRAHAASDIPLDKNCGCPTCRRFSRAYLCHLFKQKEMLCHMALSIHNIYFYLEVMREARAAILEDRYAAFQASFLHRRGGAGTSGKPRTVDE
ncbi:MAG: queuine tRNA-ribosyltransferase [Myxococcota bacterium]|jgi:queuine tRNA-ribosyltransferase